MNDILTQPAQHSGPGFADYVGVVKRRIWHLLIPFLVCTLVAVGIAMLLPKEYQSMTEVVIEDPDTMVSSVFAGVGVTVPHKHLLTTIQHDVKRIEFLAPLVEQYGITEGFNLSIPRERNRLFEKVRKRLVVTGVPVAKGPDVFAFQYEGRDPVKVARFVNGVRRAWQDEFTRQYSNAVRAVENDIEAVYKEALSKFTEAQKRLKLFQENNGSDYFGRDPGAQVRTLLATLTTDLENDELVLKGEEASLRSVMAQLDKTPATKQLEGNRTRNPEWTAQSIKINVLQGEITHARTVQGLYDNWPTLRDKLAQLEIEKQNLQKIDQWVTDTVVHGTSPEWQFLTNKRTDLEQSIAARRDKIDRTRKRIQEVEKSVNVVPEKALEATKLHDAVSTALAQYERAARSRDGARATGDRVATKMKTMVRVVSEVADGQAKFQDPVYPNLAFFAGVGAFIGLFLGAGIAFLAEFASPSFTTASQVRYSLNVPVLGEVAPLTTHDEVARARRRRRTALIIVLAVVLVIVAIHVMWFDAEDWRRHLPPFLRDVMRGIYGAR